MPKNKKIVITDKFLITHKKPLSTREEVWDSRAQIKVRIYKSGGNIFWAYSWFGPLRKTILWKLGKWDQNTFNCSDARAQPNYPWLRDS